MGKMGIKTTITKDGQLMAKIKDLVLWDKNPREITVEDYQELKDSIQKLGLLAPLKVNTGEFWGECGLVLGGNHRTKVLIDRGDKEIWVKFVSPKDEKEALEIAFTDNARYARYVAERVAELTINYRDDLGHLRVDLSSAPRVRAVINTYAPSGSEVGLPAPKSVRDTDQFNKRPEDEYMNSMVKQVVLFFSGEEYGNFFERIDPIFQEPGVESNTDVVLFLLDFYESNKAKETNN